MPTVALPQCASRNGRAAIGRLIRVPYKDSSVLKEATLDLLLKTYQENYLQAGGAFRGRLRNKFYTPPIGPIFETDKGRTDTISRDCVCVSRIFRGPCLIVSLSDYL